MVVGIAFLVALYVGISFFEIGTIILFRDFEELFDYSFGFAVSVFFTCLWWLYGGWKDRFLIKHLLISWFLIANTGTCLYFTLLAQEAAFLNYINIFYVRPVTTEAFMSFLIIFMGLVFFGFFLWWPKRMVSLFFFFFLVFNVLGNVIVTLFADYPVCLFICRNCSFASSL